MDRTQYQDAWDEWDLAGRPHDEPWLSESSNPSPSSAHAPGGGAATKVPEPEAKEQGKGAESGWSPLRDLMQHVQELRSLVQQLMQRPALQAPRQVPIPQVPRQTPPEAGREDKLVAPGAGAPAAPPERPRPPVRGRAGTRRSAGLHAMGTRRRARRGRLGGRPR